MKLNQRQRSNMKYKLKDVLVLKYGKSQKKIEEKSGKYNIYGTSGVVR